MKLTDEQRNMVISALNMATSFFIYGNLSSVSEDPKLGKQFQALADLIENHDEDIEV